MRAGAPAVAAAIVLLGACTGGDGTGIGPSSTASTVTSTAPPTTATTVLTTIPVTDPAGSVTLRVTAFVLPDLRFGGTGLRLLVRAAGPRLTVRRPGAGGGVAVCPVTGASSPVAAGDCRELGSASTVEIPVAGGVELRATGGDAAVDEVTLTYLPADRTTTLVTPARPPFACTRPCDITLSLVPGRAGPFVLDGRAGGGRPRLVLTTAPAAGGSNRTLATVEGGGSLSIRATLEAGWEATLLHHEQGPDAVSATTAEISWP